MSRQRPTREERRKIKQAAKQLNTKLKLEKQLSSKIRKFLKRQNNKFLRQWKRDDSVIDANEFIIELEEILSNHYYKSASKFVPLIVEQINTALRDVGEEPISKGDPAILAAILAFTSLNVSASAQKITNTSNNEISSAMNQFDGDGVEVHGKLRARALPRSETIGATETQKAVEGSKSVTTDTAQDVAIAGAVRVIAFENTKTWMPRNDGDVRPEHDAARFQEVNVDVPFFVGGEQLMYPGDISLGASVWNTIHCRCTSVLSTRVK